MARKDVINTDGSMNLDRIGQFHDDIADHTTQLASIATDVKKFGAKGDGVTDDTLAIQSAIDYVYNSNPSSVFSADWNQRGGVVYLPPGSYKAGTLYLKEGVHLKGHSVDSVKIVSSGIIESTYAITNKYQGSVDGYRNVTISDLSIVGNDLYLLKDYNSNIKNVSVYNATNGLLAQLTVFAKIDNFRAYGCGTGININGSAGVGPSTSIYLNDIWVAHCTTGILLNGGTNWLDTISVNNLIVEYCTDPITIYGGSKDNHGISFANLHLEQNTSYVKIQDSSVLFDNVYFDDISVLNMVLIPPSKSYTTTVSIKNAIANVYVQPNVLSTIYYENLYQINDNSTAKYISPDKSNVYSSTSGSNLLKDAYKYFNRVDMVNGNKAVFDLIVLSDDGYWIGKAYLILGTTMSLIPDGSSVITLTQNASGTVVTTAGGTNAVFKVKFVC